LGGVKLEANKNVTTAERAHEEFLNTIQNKEMIKDIISLAPKFRAMVNNDIMVCHQNRDSNGKTFLRWVLKRSEKDYYIMLLPTRDGVCLIKKNLKGQIIVGYNRPNDKTKKYFPGYHHILEVHNIDSAQKGQGFRMMKQFLELADRLKLPVSLWTETEELVKYFERYGFENYGAIGQDGEYMMVYGLSKN
jgi:hypothetical protein